MKVAAYTLVLVFSSLVPQGAQQDDDSLITLLTAESAAERNTPIPHFVLRDLKGRLWSDHDLHGRITLVTLERQDCHQCLRDLTNLSQLALAPDPNQPVMILALRFDRAPSAQAQDSRYPFPVLLGNELLQEPVGLPRTWILDYNAVIRDVIVGNTDVPDLKDRIRMVGARWRQRR